MRESPTQDADVDTLEVPPRTTFVVPGRNRSGGVRVTVEMANRLDEMGYPVRIAAMRDRGSLLRRLKSRAKAAIGSFRGRPADDWLVESRGVVDDFDELADIGFEAGEVLIAVGSLTIPCVRLVDGPITKVRFCHGIAHGEVDRMSDVWAGDMPTLVVSRTLIPRLRGYAAPSVGPIWHVPNGIDGASYFDEQSSRTAVGTIFSRHEAKSPADILGVMRRLKAALPEASRIAFSAERKPGELEVDLYRRLPEVDEARALYNRSRVWLLMSHREGLPGPVLEAMASGAVVVSTDNEGSREIIRHGENGLLFPVGDVEACVRLVVGLWRNEEEWQRLARAGLETARSFRWEAAVKKMRRSLHDIIRGETRYAEPCV